MNETIAGLLAAQAASRPNHPALVEADPRKGRTLTYGNFDAEVSRAASWLSRRGLKKGSAVLLFVPVSADLYVALLALFRIGAVALFLDPSAGREHLARCCARWRPDALLASPKAHLLRLTCPSLRSIPLRFHTGGGWIPGSAAWLSGEDPAGDVPPPAVVSPDDPALVTFTSGSTGVPKGAVRTHGFLLAQYRALAPAISLAEGDVDLATLPVFTLANLAAGITTVLPSVDLRHPGRVPAAPLFEQITRLGVTRITASPAFFERLTELHRDTGRTLPGLRLLHTGGAPVFPRLLGDLEKLAPNARVVALYGSTEAEPVAHVASTEISPEDLASMRAGRGLLAGHPVPEISLAILRDRWGTPRGRMTPEQWRSEIQPAGQAGEIVVSGEHVLPGYLGGVGDEETKFNVAGRLWHRTGDAGLLDAGGRLWLLGRCSAALSQDGSKVYPFGIECVAMSFPEVRRAAAVSHRGKTVLVVELKGQSAPSSGLVAAVKAAGAAELKTLPKLPVDARHNAKVDYPALRKLLGERTPPV